MAAPIYDPLGWNAPGNTLQDLYNWYQTGGDEEDTTTTSPATSEITSTYYPPEPFDVRQATSVGYTPDYGNPYSMEDDEADPFFQQRADPNLLERFGIGARDVLSGITNAIPFSFPNMLSKLGRPADAIYSYSGDVTGYGSRAGLTTEEVRNMELLEQMGGVDDLGKDKYGINVVSAFGNYTAYNENRVAELKDIVASQKKRGLKDTIQMKELEDRTGVQEGIEEDEEKTMKEIQKINEMKKLGYKEPSIVSPITALKTSPIQAAKDAAAEQAAFEREVKAADVRRDFQQAVATARKQAALEEMRGGVGRATGGSGAQGTPSGEPGGQIGGLGGHGPARWAKGGRVQYGNGGIVDLL